MRELTSFDHLSIGIELKKQLGSSHFQKISPIPNGYKIRFRRGTLLFLPPDKLYLTSYSIDATEPDRISQKIRKEVGGLRLQDVRTLNIDRVFLLDFGERKIVFELFREGNVVLLDENDVILDVLYPGSWRDRALQRGVMYNTPSPPPISKGELLTDSFLIRDLVRSGIPKPYALEVISRIGADEKAPTTSINKKDILETIEELLDELRTPSGYLCDEEPYPIPLHYLSCEKVEDSFNTLIDRYTPELITAAPSEKKQKKTKLDHMLESLKTLENEISQLEAAISEIYEHWSELEVMLTRKEFRTVGKLRFRKKEDRYAIFDFTP